MCTYQVSWLLPIFFTFYYFVYINSKVILPILQFPYDIYLMLCVQSWTPDDERKDRPKRVEWYSINSKIVHLVGFTKEIYHGARSHER
jgi:hypothetical protein